MKEKIVIYMIFILFYEIQLMELIWNQVLSFKTSYPNHMPLESNNVTNVHDAIVFKSLSALNNRE